MKTLLTTLSLALMANAALAADQFTVKTVEVTNFEVSHLKAGDIAGAGGGGQVSVPAPTGPSNGGGFSFDQAGQVISTAQNLVALGESIYNLVQKGKPSSKTDFAPLSIVPKDPTTKEIIDPFELETCSFPVEKKYKTAITTGGAEVVKFEYMVIYTYGCSYNGAGKYIQAASVIPVSVRVGYGWDFNASMKLAGIMNHGTKADPVAGAMLSIKYSMNSWRSAFEKNDTIHITGDGQLKTYTR